MQIECVNLTVCFSKDIIDWLLMTIKPSPVLKSRRVGSQEKWMTSIIRKRDKALKERKEKMLEKLDEALFRNRCGTVLKREEMSYKLIQNDLT